MGALDNLKIEEIKALADSAPFRLDSKDNEDAKKIFEIKGKRINLRFDCPRELRNMAPMGYQIFLEPYKLFIYENDGVFKKHSRTSHGKNHIGTLVICLPVLHKGGEFILTDDMNELRLPFDELMKDRKIPWVAFYNDMKQKVKVVKSGIRIMLQYDLRISPKVKNSSHQDESEYPPRKLKLKQLHRNQDAYELKRENNREENLEQKLEGWHLTQNVYKLQGYNQEVLSTFKDKLKAIFPEKSDSLYCFDEGPSVKTDGIAILLTRKYGIVSLSPDSLRGIDSSLYHALKDDFTVEVKHVILEQSSTIEGDYEGQPVEVVALSQVLEVQDSEGEGEWEVGPNSKCVPKKCLNIDQDQEQPQRFIQKNCEESKGQEYSTKKVKKVYLIPGSAPKLRSKLAEQKFIEDEDDYAQPARDSFLYTALFVYPK